MHSFDLTQVEIFRQYPQDTYVNDHEQLAIGMKIYDGLCSWAKYVQQEKHTWSPTL